MNELLKKYYPADEAAYPILYRHSRMVADKALAIGKRLSTHHPIDLQFIEEAALLHDIGIFMTDAPEFGCHGEHPYLAHGYLGRDLLEREGLSRHALVCERHIGVGLSLDDVISQSLPLPHRNMQPATLEEEIITYADLFFSKSDPASDGERTYAQVREKISRHGADKSERLDRWHALFTG